jgi:hypothetical protein
MLKYFYLTFFLFVFISCRPSEKAKPGQGIITYKISYPGEKPGIKNYLLPKEITLVFKDDKATFIASAGFGMIQIVNLMDNKSKTFSSLLIDEIRGNYACTLTTDEIKKNENSVTYSYTKTKETKMIAGLNCKKVIVKDETNGISFPAYYYDKIAFNYWNSPYKDFEFLLTEYSHTINGLTLKLEATNIDISSPIDTSLFNIKGQYTWVSSDKYFEHLARL